MTPPLLRVAAVAFALGCASGAPNADQSPAAPPSASAGQDSLAVNLIPAGFGSLRQDDIAMRVQLAGYLVKAIPLDESVIRVLSPDSYRALRDLLQSQRARIDGLAARNGGRQPVMLYVSFYGLEPDARFSPQEIVIRSSGRDYRPIEIIPLSSGFGEQRLRQRETQTALYAFDEAVNIAQPLSLTVEGAENNSWGTTLRTIERERSLVRSRSGRTGEVR